jgi:hypothetical protein
MTIASIIFVCAFLLLFVAACISLILQKSKCRTHVWQEEEKKNKGEQTHTKNITSFHHEKAAVQKLKVYSEKNKKSPSFFRRGSRQNGQ